MSLQHADDGARSGKPMHEERDIDARAILGYGVGLGLVMIVVCVVVWAMLVSLTRQEQAAQPPESPVAGDQDRLPAEPRLQTSSLQDLRDLDAVEAKTLTSYGWVDRANGVVRIPIDEAMRLTIERGLPSRSQ